MKIVYEKFLSVATMLGLLFAVGVTAPRAMASGKPDSLKDSLKSPWTCTSPAALSASGKALDTNLEAWFKKTAARKIKARDFNGSHEGRLTELFAAQLLPSTSHFRKLYRQCWLQYVNFTTAIDDRKMDDAVSDFDAWKNCVQAGIDPLPSEAQDLIDCWAEASDSKAHAK